MNNSIKVVILAGGLGTRLQEETTIIPKPLVSIGDYPVLWHIMKIYASQGFHEFIICLGYKGHLIKQYFANYFLRHSDVTFDFTNGKEEMIIHTKKVDPWKVTLVDTGVDTQTGGRINRIEPFVKDQTFMLTYGDIVADVNLNNLLAFHRSHQKIATVTAVQPPGKWGALQLGQNMQVDRFDEKPPGEGGWINGGFFVLNPSVFQYLKTGDPTIWERAPLEKLSQDQQLMAYCHRGFWHSMDTLKQKNDLESMWNAGNCPWKIW